MWGRKGLCPVFALSPIKALKVCLGKVSMESFPCPSWGWAGLQVRARRVPVLVSARQALGGI